MKYYKIVKTPVGELTLLSENQKLITVYFDGHAAAKDLSEAINKKDLVLDETARQLRDYFNRKLTTFNLPLDLRGTEFQVSVWKILTKIPYGKTISYGEQAKMLGDPKKARAVGGANGRNPIPLIVPCHRVIGKNGSLTGFGGGIKIKEFLLDLESPNLFNQLEKPRSQLAL